MISNVRIRMKTGEIQEPIEHKGKWAFEVSLWTMDGETMVGEPIGPFGPFDTQKDALAEGKKAVQMASESIEEGMGFKPSGKYLDMKNGGVLRSWIEQ